MPEDSFPLWTVIVAWMFYLRLKLAPAVRRADEDTRLLDHNYRRTLRQLRTDDEAAATTSSTPVLVRLEVPCHCGADVRVLPTLVLPVGCWLLGVERGQNLLTPADCLCFLPGDRVVVACDHARHARLLKAILLGYFQSERLTHGS
jgi:hypothetical protein